MGTGPRFYGMVIAHLLVGGLEFYFNGNAGTFILMSLLPIRYLGLLKRVLEESGNGSQGGLESEA